MGFREVSGVNQHTMVVINYRDQTHKNANEYSPDVYRQPGTYRLLSMVRITTGITCHHPYTLIVQRSKNQLGEL